MLFFADAPTSEWLLAFAEKIAPYFFTGGGGIAVKIVWDKLSNRRREKSEISKTDALTEQTQATTAQNLTKELVATAKELSLTTTANGELTRKLVEKDQLHFKEIAAQNEEIRQIADDLRQLAAEKEQIEIKAEKHIAAFRRLAEKLGLAYWEADGKGRTVFVSEAWHSMFDVFADTENDWGKNVLPEDLRRLQKEWRKLLADQETSAAFEFSLKLGDDVKRMKSVYVIIRASNGDIYKIIGVTKPV